MQRSIPILWGLVIILLVLNLLLLDALNLARRTAIETLSQVETMLDGMANEVIVYNVEVDQAVPVKVDVPFNRNMEIPLNTVVPIDQVLTVPFQTPAGEVVLDVPVKTEVPINTVVPVNFNQTISVDTVVQLNTTLPVTIDIAQTPLAGYLRQAQSDIAELRRRLALQRKAATAEDTRINPAPTAAPGSQSRTLPAESEVIPPPVSEIAVAPDTSEIAQQLATDLSPSSDQAADQARLGLCTHPYWPLWAGTTWTYNSRDTSYTQRVDSISDSQVFLSTQYEGRTIQSTLACSPEGLGGSYLGDVRRISELGDLRFSNPRGTFLPLPEMMEELGRSWRQELDVGGTVRASQGDSPVEGRIDRGRAVAVYTPVRFESVETPLGPQEALRVEQKLDLELEIGFDLGGETIPATETVSLSTVYWFVRGIGLVKMHWQGGTLQQTAEMGDTPVDQPSPVPALAEDQLVMVCVTLTDQSVQCARTAGVSESDLTVPPEAELAVQGLVFPGGVGDEGASVAGAPSGRAANDDQSPGRSTGDDGGRADLLAYVSGVESLGGQLSKASQAFWEAAVKFRDDQLTLDEFRDKFLAFDTQSRELIQGIRQLSPPPEAEAIHRKLTNGLAKCERAVNLMDEWFDAPSSSTKESAALLVAECVEDVTAAGEELTALTGEN